MGTLRRRDMLSPTRWEPFREMDEFLRNAPSFFGRPWWRRGDEATEWSPAADIIENEKEYTIKAELPEVRKEDVKITLAEGMLTLSGERKHEKEQKDENEIRIERFYGTFSRSFALPEDADTKGIRAESKEGVLCIHIPKTETKKSKPVEIEVK